MKNLKSILVLLLFSALINSCTDIELEEENPQTTVEQTDPGPNDDSSPSGDDETDDTGGKG
ncbi:hypothetical protein [Winogradskyella sp.]|uniref:hypothetical protein n=1 Tax=Winogradskyella sp. TaxID=1883156 RepID=UPI003AB605D1